MVTLSAVMRQPSTRKPGLGKGACKAPPARRALGEGDYEPLEETHRPSLILNPTGVVLRGGEVVATRKAIKKPTRKADPLKVRERSETVDDYLAAVRPDARASLLKLRKAIAAAAPEATEGISYQVPTFKQDGHPLVSYGAATSHLAFYVQSPSLMRAHAAELKGYAVGKGCIQFPPDEPLPTALVTKLVKARIAEVDKRGYR